MRNQMVLFVSLLCLFSAPFAFGLAAYIPLPQKVADSDLIARVTILSTHRLQRSERYKSLAKAKVVEAIKGSRVGEIIQLEYDNGLVCPNVHYSKNEDVIIFAVKMDNGHYYTYNTYNGKYKVKTYDKVKKEIKRYLEKESVELIELTDKL